MADTYARYTRFGGATVCAVDHPVPATEFEKLVAFLNLTLTNIGFRLFLGGARQAGVRSASWVDHPEAVPQKIADTWFPGLTLAIDVWVKTSNAATSVSVRVVNEDATVVGAASTPSTSTSWTKVTLVTTLATGTKTHTLQIQGGNADNDVYAHGAQFYAVLP